MDGIKGRLTYTSFPKPLILADSRLKDKLQNETLTNSMRKTVDVSTTWDEGEMYTDSMTLYSSTLDRAPKHVDKPGKTNSLFPWKD